MRRPAATEGTVTIMKFGIHSMVWVGDWSEEHARYAIESTARAGYDIIELAAIEPETFDSSMTAGLLEDNGLGCTASLGLDPATDVSSEDMDIVRAGRKRLDLALDLVRDCGGTMLAGVIYGALTKFARPASPASIEHSQETIADLADTAASSGISIGLEVCNRYETNILNTAQQALDYIADIDRPNVFVHLDTYHMNIEENSLSEAVHAAAAAGKLGYVHVGESHRGHLGTGSVNWPDLFGALEDVGYDGTITFESFSSQVVHPTFSNTLAIWRDLWSDSDELARSAREFLRRNLGR